MDEDSREPSPQATPEFRTLLPHSDSPPGNNLSIAVMVECETKIFY